MVLPKKYYVAAAAVAGLILCVLVFSWWNELLPFGAPGKEERRLLELANAELDPAKQKLIWDNEHITFQLERRFGAAFLQALLEKNSIKMEAFLTKDFQGKVLASEGAKTRIKGPLSEIRREARDCGSAPVDASGLADTLLASLSPFQQINRKMLRVLRIEQLAGAGKRFRSKLLLGFVGVDQNNKPILLESEHWIECRIDNAKTIDRVAFIDRWEMEREVLRRSKSTFMEEATELYGLADLPIPDNWELENRQAQQNRFQFAVADYNRDGFLDIAVAVNGEKPLLLESVEGKGFQDVASKRGVKHSSSADKWDYVAAWIDYDNDDYPDLIVNGRLYHNVQGKSFEDVTAESGLTFQKECMGCTVVDYDCDGLLDLYVLYQRDHEGPAPKAERWVNDEESGHRNQLWHNEGGGRFRDVTKESRAGGGKRHTHAAAWLYYDDDHYPDVYLANDFGKNVLLRNRGDGSFEDVSNESGAVSFATSMGVAAGDVNNDGQPDLYLANMFSKMGRRIIGQLSDRDYPEGIFEQIKGSCAGNQLYIKAPGQGKYVDHSVQYGVNKVGWAYAPAMFDVDGDGWLDLYATTGFMSFEPGEPDG